MTTIRKPMTLPHGVTTDFTLAIHQDAPGGLGPGFWETHAEDIARQIERAAHASYCAGVRQSVALGIEWAKGFCRGLEDEPE